MCVLLNACINDRTGLIHVATYIICMYIIYTLDKKYFVYRCVIKCMYNFICIELNVLKGKKIKNIKEK